MIQIQHVIVRFFICLIYLSMNFNCNLTGDCSNCNGIWSNCWWGLLIWVVWDKFSTILLLWDHGLWSSINFYWKLIDYQVNASIITIILSLMRLSKQFSIEKLFNGEEFRLGKRKRLCLRDYQLFIMWQKWRLEGRLKNFSPDDSHMNCIHSWSLED